MDYQKSLGYKRGDLYYLAAANAYIQAYHVDRSIAQQMLAAVPQVMNQKNMTTEQKYYLLAKAADNMWKATWSLLGGLSSIRRAAGK